MRQQELLIQKLFRPYLDYALYNINVLLMENQALLI